MAVMVFYLSSGRLPTRYVLDGGTWQVKEDEEASKKARRALRERGIEVTFDMAQDIKKLTKALESAQSI